ncbi:MFS transporter [Georgenia muralis]|uniref:Putative MFS family arabinose efflux permease n=1 Tax=Georgenia muralis TaxID=154117 RepID=A0A3N5A6A6_9MICO|nr:MFS transporter [Georgenia muralis]RPF28925.1 putative MFS family arabinose efflux permease [Georgenia muralis]
MTTTGTLPTASRERLFTRPFVMLGLAELAYFTADGVAIYALPLYVTGPLGADTAAAGLAFGAFAVVALVARPFAGRVADTRGRRPSLVAGALLCAACMALTPLAGGLGGVVGLRLVLGLAEAAFFVAAVAALMDLAPASRIGEAMSYNSLGLYLGLTAGPPLGELLVRAAGFTTAWLAAAAFAAASAALAAGIGETRPAVPAGPDGAGEPAERHLVHRASVPVGLVFLASMVAMGGFLAFAALHAESVGMSNASLPLATYGIVVVTCRILFARVPDRFPALRLATAAVATMAAGLGLVALWPTPFGAVVGAAVMGLGITFSTPALFAAIFALAGPDERGAASGTASAAIDLGIGLGPMLLGVVAESAGIPWAFGVAAGIALAGAVWALTLVQRERVARPRSRPHSTRRQSPGTPQPVRSGWFPRGRGLHRVPGRTGPPSPMRCP